MPAPKAPIDSAILLRETLHALELQLDLDREGPLELPGSRHRKLSSHRQAEPLELTIVRPAATVMPLL